MAEREPQFSSPKPTQPSRLAFEFIKRLVEKEKLTVKQRGGDKVKDLRERRTNWLTEMFTPERVRAERAHAREWTQSMRSGSEHNMDQARMWARKNRYEPKSIAEARTIHERATKHLGRTSPDWLDVSGIQHSASAMEFATRLAVLPDELRNDPNVLYREVARLYQSPEFVSSEAAAEWRDVLSQGIAKVKELGAGAKGFGGATEEGLLRDIRDRGDIYRVFRPEKPVAGAEPIAPTEPRRPRGNDQDKWDEYHEKKDAYDVKKAAYDRKKAEWNELRIKERQWEDMDQLLDNRQLSLDSPASASLNTQREILQDIVRKLEDGKIERRYVKEVDEEMNKYDAKLAETYVQRARVELVDVNQRIDEEQTLRNKMQREEQDSARRDQAEEAGNLIRWNKDLNQRFPEGHHAPDDMLTLRYLNNHDLALLRQDAEGQMRWLAEFRRKHTTVLNGYRIDLHEQSRLSEALDVVDWLWGPDYPFAQRLRDWSSSFETTDSVIRSIETRPKPGKPEDWTRDIRLMSPEQVQALTRADLFNLAKVAETESIAEIMRRELADYTDALNALTGKNSSGENDPRMLITLNADTITPGDLRDGLQTHIDKIKEHNRLHPDDRHEITEVEGIMGKIRAHRGGQDLTLTRNEFLHALDALATNGRLPGNLGGLRNEIQLQVDRVGMGVLLRDFHMRPAITEHPQLSREQRVFLDKLAAIKRANPQLVADARLEHPEMSPQQIDREIAQKLLGEGDPTLTPINKEIQRLWREKVTMNDNADLEPTDTHTVNAVQGLSPVQIEARERIIANMVDKAMTGEHHMTHEQAIEYVKSQEWKIYEAIWAAHAVTVGTGEAMEIGAKLGRMSQIDLKWVLGREANSKYFMNRGYAEAYQRIINPNLFADDFTIGGPIGDKMRDLYYTIAFKMVGYDFLRDKNVPDYWKDRLRDAERKGKPPQWYIYLEYATQELGIDYSEAIRPELLVTGLSGLSSAWRTETGILDALESLFKRGDRSSGESPEYLALGHRYNTAKEGERTVILEELLKRKVSVFVNLIGDDLTRQGPVSATRRANERILPAEWTVGGKDWEDFRRALAVAETRLWRDENFKYKAFNFGDGLANGQLQPDSDFMRVMPGALRAIGVEPTNELLTQYAETIQRVQGYMHGSDTPNGKSRLKNWTEHRFHNNLMISNSDFDWQEVDWRRMGSFSLERRINDLVNQSQARDLQWELLYKEDFFSPIPGKEADLILKLEEFRDKIVGYAGFPSAEPAVAAVFQTIVEWNRDRTARSLTGWVPLLPNLMKRGEDIGRFVGSIPGGKAISEKLTGRSIDKWPKNLAQAVSLDIGESGWEGNAWDEGEIAKFFISAHQRNLFRTDKGKLLLHKMEHMYGTGLLNRMFYMLPRKYWWVIPVATIALATTQSMKDEEKEGQRH